MEEALTSHVLCTWGLPLLQPDPAPCLPQPCAQRELPRPQLRLL